MSAHALRRARCIGRMHGRAPCKAGPPHPAGRPQPASAPKPHCPPHRQVADQQHGRDGVVHAEVQAAVHDDTDAGDDKAAVQAGDAVRGHRLAVHVHQAVELARAALLGALVVVGQARTRVVQAVHKRKRRRAGGAAGRHVAWG